MAAIKYNVLVFIRKQLVLLIAAILDFDGHLGYIENGNNFIFRLAHVFKQLQVRKSILLKK